ncbi:uncharacterized protein LOC117332830 [Pecten maximus]|uniref:uncharacterized protein LOC117332830 n=1 Tax=Pecten maximus TaxID=6579 RepID=UPI001458E592|nr:uncharacterized protein LOC117332830 [Pecten maximus]
MMHEPKYHTRVGSTVFLDCSVIPVPERILWKRNKSPPPTAKLFDDNHKYYYGTTSPTLVIKNPNKTYDEAHYQCTAEANGKVASGDIVQLQVSDDEPRESSTTERHSQQSGERGVTMKRVYTVALVSVIFGIQMVLSDYDYGSSLSDLTSNGWALVVCTVSVLLFQWLWCRVTDLCSHNQGCLMLLKAKNANIDMERQESKQDIESTFAKGTHQDGRVKNVELKNGSVQVCIDITAARSPLEPSSVHLAEEFKHYLLDGGTIQLTDESQTVLDIDNDSFQITPHKAREDDLPYVNISHGEFIVPVGKTAIIQSYVIASLKVTSIQWFKIEGDEDIPIEIDNKRYFGSCNTSPTLIIRKTNNDDQGQYMCTATNCKGTGWSDVSVLSIQSGNAASLSNDTSDVMEDVGTVRYDADAVGKDDDNVSGDACAVSKGDDNVSGDAGAVSKGDDVVNDDTDTTKLFRSKERGPNVDAMIETTKVTVIDQMSRQEVISTHALENAKKMVKKNGIVLIKGASGDGKTVMCYQLLKWLMDGEDKDSRLSKVPLQLYSMTKWDKIVKPKLQLALFIDDVKGEIVEELKKRKRSIQSGCRGKLDNESNCLILNVRHDVFKRTQLSSCELFNEENTIDLRGQHCLNTTEKQRILKLYVPKINTLSGEKKAEIVTHAPNIGFPLCCRLFRDKQSLQEEGVNFFKHPVLFIENVIEKLPKEYFYALLFLFLNEGRFKIRNLDPSSEHLDKEKLDIAFYESQLHHKDKIRSLRRSFDELLGSLVAITADNDDSFYEFCHYSVQETVAILYGKETENGFIGNCPRKFLHLISTSKSTPNRIVISANNERMYERLVREFESSSDSSISDYIVSLDVWTDLKFLQGFKEWLRDQNVENHKINNALLNGACSAATEECAFYLLSQGVTPDHVTPYCVVEGGSVQLLEKLLTYGAIPKARADKSRSSHYTKDINVLHEACLFEREEMVTMLCDTYPDLVNETDYYGHSTLHLVAMTGNCGIFQRVESSSGCQQTAIEENLMQEIKVMEEQEQVSVEDLENIRLRKIEGSITRSRVKWQEKGEKPTRREV